MGRLILILGGARSGKSTFAQELAGNLGGEHVLYVATAEAGDKEMQQRIVAHRQARPSTWQTVEAPVDVGKAIHEALAIRSANAVLLDCFTLLVSNVILQGASDGDPDDVDDVAAWMRVEAELDGVLDTLRAGDMPWIVVSNEVGWGLVPPCPLGRVYRDLLGRANQRMAAMADQVYLMIAGMPVDVKALAAAHRCET